MTEKDEQRLKTLIKDELKDINHICIQSGSLGRMEEKINNLVLSTSAHTKVISDLVTFQASHDGELRGKKQSVDEKAIADNLARQKKQDLYWKLATIATIILTAIGLYLGIK